MSRLTVRDRLGMLPEIFTLKTVSAMFEWDGRTASHYIARWKEAGLVSSLGERASVHFNLMKDPDAPTSRLVEAVRVIAPGAVIVGTSALHAACVTTQIPRLPQIAIPYRPSFPEIPSADVSTRTAAWRRRVNPFLVPGDGAPVLPPEIALADLWASTGWLPDPDDIDPDEIDESRLEKAFALMGIEAPDWRPDRGLSGMGW